MEKYMKRALELAELGAGFVSPNPLVGAVIASEDRIIAEGYHEAFGGPHAEINAFNDADKRGETVKGATMFVTLEPCSHYGKTPPCADEIVKRGIAKVVIATADPNPKVSGKGIKILKEAGITVELGVLEEAAKKQNEIFLKYITTKIPFCIMKTAMSLDGKIATHTGDSKWITNELSREHVHKIRQKVSAVMVGINTVISDDPLLNTRLPNRKCSDSVKIVVDSSGKIPLDAKILTSCFEKETIVAATEKMSAEKKKQLEDLGCNIIIAPEKEGKVDLAYLVEKLGEIGIDSILLEGGGTLNFSALEQGIVDKVESFIAPVIIGGKDSKTPVEGRGVDYVKDAVKLHDIETEKFGEDILIRGYIKEL